MPRLIIGYGILQILMVRHVIFNFSTNLTNEKCSLSEDWDLAIFDCRLEKKDTFCNWAHIQPQILAKESPDTELFCLNMQ